MTLNCPYCGQAVQHAIEVGGLTQRQADLLQWLKNRDWSTGVSPSYSEICAGLNYASKAGIHRMIHALVERGFITFIKYRRRSIKLIMSTERNDGPPAQEPAEKTDIQLHLQAKGEER